MSFADLKKSSKSNSVAALKEKIKSKNAKNYVEDERPYWKLTRDKSDSGYATIRFMPAPSDEALPWAEYFHHSFQDPQTEKYYIQRSLSTFEETDPLSELNFALWNTGDENLRNDVRRMKRKVKYVTNILVVDDPTNPENNGKVFLYEFGPAIFKMIEEAIDPEFEDQESVNVFDFWKGANFKIRVRKDSSGWIKYDKSEFESPSPVTDKDGNKLTEAQLKEVYSALHSLEEVNDRKFFKTYDELKTILVRVTGNRYNSYLNVAAAPGATQVAEATPSKETPAREESNEKNPDWDSKFDNDTGSSDNKSPDDDDDLDLSSLLDEDDEIPF